MPPLTALRFFHALGKETSIRKTAAQLNVTHTAVVRQIRILEAWLGASLVETTSSGTALNLQGQRLHRSLGEAFNIISDAVSEIRPRGQMRELRVCAPPGFATFWILPRLHEIQQLMPTVGFEIIPFEADRYDANAFDIEIAYSDRESSGLVCIELIRPKMYALASPQWLQRNPGVRSPRDLLSVNLIHERMTDVWRNWFEAMNMHPTHLAGPRVGTLTTVLEAVHMDQGPGLFADVLVNDQLTRGRLQFVVPDAPRVGAYVLATTTDRYADPAIRKFSDWLFASLDSARRD